MDALIECEFNITVAIQKKSGGYTNGRPDGGGWANKTGLGSVLSRRRQLSGKDIIQNDGKDWISTDRFYFNDTTLDILPGNRIVYDSQNYYILRVDNPHGLNEFLQVDTSLTYDK